MYGLYLQINVLIEDLGLEQVRNTKVSGLTVSERRRLNVACHLLLDTDVVLLDQPTRGMDIFDTFFLVEYLRQWANGGSGNALGKKCVLLKLFSVEQVDTLIFVCRTNCDTDFTPTHLRNFYDALEGGADFCWKDNV